MAFLTIAGTTYPVQVQSAQENASRFTGEKTPAFNNTLRSSRRSRKRSWGFALGPMTQADYNALQTAVQNDALVSVSGDFNGGAAVSCMVEVSSAPFNRDALSFLRVAIVTIDEV